MRGAKSSLDESDVDPAAEETCSTTVSVTPELTELCVTPEVDSRTLIIFDWDDTILPTSFLAKRGYKLDTPAPTGELRAQLDEYARRVNRTLAEAAKRGHVIVVTNAETGWIQLTVEKFLPLAAGTVHRFQHISARSMFEPSGVLTPVAWKESAFRLVVEEYLEAMGAPSRSRSSGSLRNCQVISLGDSAHEREAVLKVCDEFRITCKSLKFMERPDLEALSKQHQLIQECLDDIVRSKDNLDLCIQTSTPKTSPETSPEKRKAGPLKGN
jgi:hypothetical protein